MIEAEEIEATITAMRRELKSVRREALALKEQYLEDLNALRREHCGDRYHAGLCPKVGTTTRGMLLFYWEKRRYLGNQAGRKPQAKHIRRNKKARDYTYARLNQYCEPWEIELVWKTEEAAESLRIRSKRLADAVDQLEKIKETESEPTSPAEAG